MGAFGNFIYRSEINSQSDSMNRLILKKALWMLVLLMIIPGASAQETPFSRGVNLTGWYQAGSAGEVQYDKYSKQDFINIKSLGFYHIRLPINLYHMSDGAPDYILDDLFIENLHRVIDWAEELQMHPILDNHTFNPSVNTDPKVGTTLNKVWLTASNSLICHGPCGTTTAALDSSRKTARAPLSTTSIYPC